VWLVSPNPMRDRPRIAAAIDPRSGGNQAFAAKVLDHARALALHVGGELHIVHAWHPAAAGLLRHRVTDHELRRYIEGAEHGARDELDRLLAAMPSARIEEQHHLVRGPAEEAIPEFSRVEQIDAIVMGSVGRAGIAGLLIGEMAEEILSRVQCGVLCVKPDGFLSPVLSADEPEAASAEVTAARGAPR
jgi:nucleotide-binding universal stress UspA family protein